MDEDMVPGLGASAFPSSPPLDPRYRCLSPTSSEPPLFSSDDPPEVVDVCNYTSPRFKRKRRGPWWESGFGGTVRYGKKTKLSRNFDSGVFLPSDFSDDSDIRSDPPPQHPEDRSLSETKPVSDAETALLRIIEENLERDSTRYEAADIGLQDSELPHLVRINQVIQAPPDPGVHVPSELQYRSMIPELYISLRSNRLLRLSPTLFDLQFLTSLNLRNNNIRTLPPHISKLRNLKQLDLINNALRWLPLEILELLPPSGFLERLHIMGNPLIEQPFYDTFCVWHYHFERMNPTPEQKRAALVDLYAKLSDIKDKDETVWMIKSVESMLPVYTTPVHHRYCHLPPADGSLSIPNTRYIARTPTAYFNRAGRLLQGSPILPTSNDNNDYTIVETARGGYGLPPTWFEPPSHTGAPSLFTTALTGTLRMTTEGDAPVTPEDVRGALDDEIPSDIEKALCYAEDNLASGYDKFRRCHCCGKEYVVAAAEWLEFWMTPGLDFVPLKVQACSWSCVPDVIRIRPHRELVN